jgi:hypothetical protein
MQSLSAKRAETVLSGFSAVRAWNPNTSAVVARELSNKRGVIRDIALGPLRREANEALEIASLQDEWEEIFGKCSI